MKKFNRVLALLLVFAMLAAAGCGGKGKTEEGQAGTVAEATETRCLPACSISIAFLI